MGSTWGPPRVDRTQVGPMLATWTLLSGRLSFVGMHDDVIKWKHFPRYWPFVREFTGRRWIPRTKASDAELWYFLWSALNKRLSKQWQGWWFEMLSCPLWRHCNEYEDWLKQLNSPLTLLLVGYIPCWHTCKDLEDTCSPLEDLSCMEGSLALGASGRRVWRSVEWSSFRRHSALHRSHLRVEDNIQWWCLDMETIFALLALCV